MNGAVEATMESLKQSVRQMMNMADIEISSPAMSLFNVQGGFLLQNSYR